jgi:DNA-binding Lrp family transcriptional regulator
MDKILTILEKDGRLSAEQIAVMLKKETGDIKKAIAKYESEGVILGYQAMIDWDKTDREYASAVIELKVVPQRDRGFDQVAAKIYQYPEVKSMYLMSGSYDLQLIIEGKTLKEVATFVAEKLAPMDAVTSTATHFVLRKYKDKGVIFEAPEKDERDN